MEEAKVYYCKPAREFKFEDLFKLVSLEPDEEEFLSYVQENYSNYPSDRPREFLMDFRATLLDGVTEPDKPRGWTFWMAYGRMDYYPNFDKISVSVFEKFRKALDSLWLIREDLHVDSRFEKLVHRFLSYNTVFNMIVDYSGSSDTYETYRSDANLRYHTLMNFIKDILPPLQYDVFKYHIEHGLNELSFLDYRYVTEYNEKKKKSHYSKYETEYYEKLEQRIKESYYTDFELKLLEKAGEKIRYNYLSEIVGIILY